MTSRRAVLLAVMALAVIGSRVTLSGASFTAQSRNPASSASSAADWTPPTVTLTDPGPAIRGTVVVAASASDAETGVDHVALSWAPVGTTAWTVLCTVTGPSASCPLVTTTLTEEEIDLRAVAVDRAGYEATVLVSAVLIDNVGPMATLGDPGSPLRGTVTLAATVSDDGSGVASVAVQHALAGTSGWSPACTALTSPWTCRWDTTGVADAAYDLRAVVTDRAGNTSTTPVVRNRNVDNRVSSVSMEDPGPYLRGVVLLQASAYSTARVVTVRIQRTATGSTTSWVDLCSTASAPYRCAWDTSGVPDGEYSVRAILVDGAGKSTTSATVGPRPVDNSPVGGADVQAVNGGTLGTVDPGDRLVLTYDHQMRPGSFVAGWDGTPRAVVARVRDGALVGGGTSDDTVDVFTTTGFQVPVAVGSVNLRVDQLRPGKTVAFSAVLSQEVVVVGTTAVTRVTVILGPVQGGNGLLRSTSLAGTVVWTPSASATDIAGVACSRVPVIESGPADRDL